MKSLRWALGVFFVLAGANHFLMPRVYLGMMPGGFPWPAFAVVASGIAEIAGGVGVLVPPLRRLAGWGLLILMVAVFPANVHCALVGQLPGFHVAPWILWLRLPFQLVFLLWIWAVTRT